MAHALNFTIPIKQDAATQELLAKIASAFTKDIQPKIDAALRKSQFVHFARVVVIDMERDSCVRSSPITSLGHSIGAGCLR